MGNRPHAGNPAKEEQELIGLLTDYNLPLRVSRMDGYGLGDYALFKLTTRDHKFLYSGTWTVVWGFIRGLYTGLHMDPDTLDG